MIIPAEQRTFTADRNTGSTKAKKKKKKSAKIRGFVAVSCRWPFSANLSKDFQKFIG